MILYNFAVFNLYVLNENAKLAAVDFVSIF